MYYTDTRNVTKWIEFERQIRNLAVAVAPLAERINFIVTPEYTAIFAGEKIGKVINPVVQHNKSAAPEGAVGKRVDCMENGICIGFKYLDNGDIIGEIIQNPNPLFRAAPTQKLNINWVSFNDLDLSPEMFREMTSSAGVFATPAETINLNISRTRKFVTSVRKTTVK